MPKEINEIKGNGIEIHDEELEFEKILQELQNS